MNRTTNYNLCQWEETDRVRRTDFNEDNVKIYAALAGKAEQSALTALTQTVAGLSPQIPAIITGSYTGDGKAERFLNLGFTPKAVFIITSYGAVLDSSNGSHTCYGGLALPGLPTAVGDHMCVEIKTGGVGLYHWYEHTSTFTRSYTTNEQNTVYYYIALK